MTRYDLLDDHGTDGALTREMHESPDGEWVRWEDARGRIVELEGAIDRLCGPHGPGGCPGEPDTCGGPDDRRCYDCRRRWAMGDPRAQEA